MSQQLLRENVFTKFRQLHKMQAKTDMDTGFKVRKHVVNSSAQSRFGWMNHLDRRTSSFLVLVRLLKLH